MAAVDTFQHYVASLSKEAQKQLAELTRGFRDDLLAARSEDARSRIVEEYIREARRLLPEKR